MSVTPNRRGARSREVVLDAAEHQISEHGYEAASVSALVQEAGVPASSIYHYFGSKEGVLLAVMERGAERFFAALPVPDRLLGSHQEHLQTLVREGAATLQRHPDFLRILVALAAQPSDSGVHSVVNAVRGRALQRLRDQMHLVFGVDPASAAADHLARFALAAFDGAFVAYQSDPRVRLDELLEHLPAALVAVRRELLAADHAKRNDRSRPRA
ncbi:MAG TPA: TetR/AcrR family transcriptional regulator [Gaiellales bacterium]|nr:TetR/AcrR family transcriptional regulator [Gaiellales bacterium]